MDDERNSTMFGGNRFKLAIFGSNCSSGRAATTVPERWQNTFAENIRLGVQSVLFKSMIKLYIDCQ